MSHKLLTDSRLFQLIQNIDADKVAAAADSPCPRCGGPLDRAFYPRKPRGLRPEVGSAFDRRPSFCCRRDGCRLRVTPALISFLGRRVYVSVVVVLASVLSQGPSPKRTGELQRLIGVSARTLRRWLAWWRQTFPASVGWQECRAALVPPVNDAILPFSLWERLQTLHHDSSTAAIAMLRLLTK